MSPLREPLGEPALFGLLDRLVQRCGNFDGDGVSDDSR